MPEITDHGPALSRVEVDRIIGSMRVTLPPDYRAFLESTNGGRPVPDTIDIPGHPESPTDIQVFFGLTREIETDNIPWYWHELDLPLPGGMVPIATDSLGNLFTIHTRGSESGQVLYLDLLSEEEDIYAVASSFTELLSSIYASEDPD